MFVTIKQTHDQAALNEFAAENHDLFVSFLNCEGVLGSADRPNDAPDMFGMNFSYHASRDCVSVGSSRLHPDDSFVACKPTILQSADRRRQWRIERRSNLPLVNREMAETIMANNQLADHFEDYPRTSNFIVEMTPADEMVVSLMMPGSDVMARPGPAMVDSIRFRD